MAMLGDMDIVYGASGEAYDPNTGLYMDVNGNIIDPSQIAAQNAGANYSDMQSAQVAAQSGAWDTLNNMIAQIPTLVTGLTSFQISQLNIARAKKGLTPINASAYGPQVAVGLNPQTRNLVMYGALGIGAVILMSALKKRN